MNFQHIYVVLLGLILTSCAETKRLVNPTNRIKKIETISYLEPIAYIDIIKKGNEPEISDSLSTISKNILDSIIVNEMSFKEKIKVELSGTEIKNIQIEITDLYDSILEHNKIRGIKLGPNLENYLKKVETQYLLTTIISGFERKKWKWPKVLAWEC